MSPLETGENADPFEIVILNQRKVMTKIKQPRSNFTYINSIYL